MTGVVAISTDRGARYPASGFSPPEPYPEYLHRDAGPGALSPGNRVYPLVRRALWESGADASRYGTPEWNPLGEWIAPGNRVFVLTNFVKDRASGESDRDFASKCTHASVLRAVIDYAALAAGDARLVTFGNAPIQSCDYGLVAEQTGAAELRDFYALRGHSALGPHDLRGVVSTFRFGAMIDRKVVGEGGHVEIDLGADSLLEDHYRGVRPVEFRVGDYPGRATMAHHGRGRHVYVLNRRILDADVIISVPKLKTHCRVGITCGVKGTVGAIASKECLAHHRLGPPERDGDEYPVASWLRDSASAWTDRADSGGAGVFDNVYRIGSKVLNRALRAGPRGVMLGMWHGNDTCWRMSVDIARLLRFADHAGHVGASPARRHIAFVDGIIGGEGEGPLRSTPHDAGRIVFGADVPLVDAACALSMGYEPSKIPIVARSFGLPSLPLTEASLDELQVLVDGEPVRAAELSRRFSPFVPPKGWRGHIEYGTPLRASGSSSDRR